MRTNATGHAAFHARGDYCHRAMTSHDCPLSHDYRRPVTYYRAYHRPYPGARVTAGDFDTRREAERAIAGCRDPHVEEVTR